MDEGRDLGHGVGSPDDPHPGDELVDLVLGDVDADRRAALAAHVLRCPECRQAYDEVARGVAELLPAVPAAQPPLGFDERMLSRLAADAPGRGASSGTGSSRRRRRFTVAAAILVAVLVPLGVWLAASDDGPAEAGDVATLRLTADDDAVGTVTITGVAGDPVMVVAILEAPEGVSYYCRARYGDGTVVDSEPWPAGVGAWVVSLPSADVAAVEVLPVGTEIVWSAATFS